MKLRRLRVVDFAAIRVADVEFGPGLNVLYGPNDLGKSTLAQAIRLALLLPHASTHGEPYAPWAGGMDPVVELTFETEAQRIWRVRKKFGKGGSSFLEESKNGVDFDDVERGRKVDARLREVLRWGIPEPGGPGGGKGLPTSFLGTVLISTQANVSDVLNSSLQKDPTSTGKDRITAALQAVARDPLFIALLSDTQTKRDEAYTDTGARRTAKGSVFKIAADRLTAARREKERQQQIVEESEGVEAQLNELTARRAHHEEAVAVAKDRFGSLERLAAEGAALAAAVEQVRAARREVARIQKIDADVHAAAKSVDALSRTLADAQQALTEARARHVQADAARASAEEVARATGSDPAVDTIARQTLDLRKAAADQTAAESTQRIERAAAAQKLVDAVAAAESAHRNHQARADTARLSLANAVAKEQGAGEQLLKHDLLERALDAQIADQRAAAARVDVEKAAALRERLESGLRDRQELVGRRAAIIVPAAADLPPMRRLAAELAAARGALDVGFIVTVTPKRPLVLRVAKDGAAADASSSTTPLELEANASVDIEIDDVATVGIRGGRRESQERVASLENSWRNEVVPHLVAAGATDLDAIDAKVADARDLDLSIKTRNAELESLEREIAALVGAPNAYRELSDRAKTCHAALGDVPLTSLAGDLAALGTDPTSSLRKRRQQLSKDLETARAAANDARTTLALGEERTRTSQSAMDKAILDRDAALTGFPSGVEPTLESARASLASAVAEQQKVAGELAALEATIAAETARIEAELAGSRTAAEQARVAVEAAQAKVTSALTEHASNVGRLDELRRLRAAQDLSAADDALRAATASHASMAAPERIVTDAEVAAGHAAMNTAVTALQGIEREIHRAHGALEQVGGAVARDRLRDAIEAFELAERNEREIEADCEAWKLLLEQMKEADAAQASNLGQTLAPAIAGRFEALTERRYESVRLTAELGTQGVVVGGAVRSTDRISVGTREQLSTLYRLSLAEYLQTTVVLDDQLVQSDDSRMGWFRSLLAEKARNFQIVVFTCRPADYLPADALVPAGNVVHSDTNAGLVRAVDLFRAVQRR